MKDIVSLKKDENIQIGTIKKVGPVVRLEQFNEENLVGFVLFLKDGKIQNIFREFTEQNFVEINDKLNKLRNEIQFQLEEYK